MKITTIRIPEKQYEEVTRFLQEKEMKLSGLVRLGIKEILKRENVKN